MHYRFIIRQLAWSCLAATSLLTACQRTPYALYQRSPQPAHQRLAAPTPAPVTEADPLLTATASRDNSPTDLIVSESAAPDVVSPTDRQPARTTTARPLRQLRKTAQPRPGACDQIVLRNGDVIEAKVKEVGVNEIRYKKCDRQDGPDYTISKRDVLSVKYSNGEVERYSAASSTSSNARSSSPPPAADGPKTDPFAIVAISAGVASFFFGGVLLAAAAVVFGAISLSRIKKQPDRFKGKGMAIAGMVAGIVAAAFVLLYYGRVF